MPFITRGGATGAMTKVARAMIFYDRDPDVENYKGEALGNISSNIITSFSSTIATSLVGAEGGNSATPTSHAPGNIADPMLTATLSSKPDVIDYLMTGTQTVTSAADASGNVTIANLLNSSVVDASTGIASVAITDASKVNAEFLIVEAVTATTVNIYIGDSSKPIEDGVAITASTTTDIADRGLQLTGGSGVIGMTVGDQAIIDTRPKNRGFTTFKPDFSLPPKPVVIDVVSQWQSQNGDSDLTVYNQLKTTFFNATIDGTLLQFNGVELAPFEINFKLARREDKDIFFERQSFSRIA